MKTILNTKLIALAIAAISVSLISCDDDDDDSVVTPAPATSTYSVSINMKQAVNGNDLMYKTMNLPYTNANGQKYNVNKLQYLISDISFNKSDGSSFVIEEYHLVDLDRDSTLIFTPSTKVPAGDYASISFTFGFDEEDNIDGEYTDLNLLSWQWPSDPNSMFGNLGGGYHFMRLEGNYETTAGGSTAPFKTHMGTARDTSVTPFNYEANHFTASPGNSAISINNNVEFDIVMNIEKWYDAPVLWDFNTWNAPIMPTYGAQKALNQNGPTVFTVDIP